MSSKKKKSNGSAIVPRRPYSKFQMVLFTLFVLAIGFYLGMSYQFSIVANLPFHFPPNNVPEHTFTNFTCKDYEFEPDKSKYLQSYKVQQGDSLLSIARNQLNDVGKVHEIVSINQDNYPDLSIANSFLEPGMTLYLPDKSWPQTSGVISGVIGQVTDVNPGGQFNVRGPDNFIAGLTQTDTSVLSQNRQIKVGDCFKGVFDLNSGNLIYGEFLN